jgi:hypothetical protein
MLKNKLKNIIYSIALVIALQGCNEGLIEYQPIDEISSKEWFLNMEQCEMFLNGAYNEYTHEHASAETWIICGNNLLGDFSTRKYTYYEVLEPTFSWTNQLWEFHYRVVNKMSLLLNNLDSLTNKEERVRIEAEARFLRGYSNLMLRRAYGEIPLRTNSPDASQPASYPKNSMEEVMYTIIADLTFAVDNLPHNWKDWKKMNYAVGRPLKGSALGYRMLAYMYEKNYIMAINDFKAIEESSRGYALLANYRDLFTLANENSQESLFEIQYQGYQSAWGRPSNTHWLNEMTMPKTNTTKKFSRFGGWYLYEISAEFCNSFEKGDARRSTCIVGEGETYIGELYPNNEAFVLDTGATITGFSCAKYWVGFEHPETDANIGSSLNLPQLRMGEVILNYAECLARISNMADAYSQLNRVRQRAGLSDKNIAGLDQFMDDLTVERRHEGFAEPNIWFDLVRSGMAAKTLKEVYNLDMKDHWQYFPIPQQEIDTNTELRQNEGY